MSWWQALGPAAAAAVLGGAAAGLLGVYIIGLRMPFLAVCTAHAALAGAVFGELLGVSHTLAAFVGALLGALLLGGLLSNRQLDVNAALGTLFSLAMGLALLGMGLSTGPKTAMLSLLWGSILFVTPAQVGLIAVVGLALLIFIIVLEKELAALLFSRQLAAQLFPESLVFGALLLFSAGVITINLEIVGGLLLYSLVCNPAVAALRVARSCRGALLLAALLGVISALGGLLLAYRLDLPVGACIVILSSLIVGVFLCIERKMKPA